MLELEPVMANAPDVAGALYSPNCQTGDSHKFANGLADWCVANKGATLRYGTTIRRLIVSDGRITKAQTDKGDIAADAFVLAAGAESVFLADAIGINLPIYPVKGFSITAPLNDPARGPHMGLVDEDKLVAMSPFGNRLRAASSAVFDGYGTTHRPQDIASILETVRHLYCNAGDTENAIYWAGLRPMTPTSVPIMGPSRYPNLFLNVGHGHVGWSMSCGSGRFVADWVGGRPTAIDGDGYLAA
jgi:D-amino-acid dehydrogenase